MVKRYLIDVYGEHEHPNGDFVHWQDYHALRAELEQVKRERDELASAFNSSCEIRERLASRAEAAERLAGARVKVLEWRGTEGVWAKADALFGATYRITEYAGMAKPFKLETVGFVGPSGHYELIDDAKAAAQADYERRILSALAEPAGEAEPKILIHEPMAWTGEGPYGFSPVATPPDASAIREALDGADEVEIVARLLWERFSSSHVQTWEEETHRSEYRIAAADCLSIIKRSKDARHEAAAFLYKHGDLIHSAAHKAIELLAGNGFTISRAALAGAKP